VHPYLQCTYSFVHCTDTEVPDCKWRYWAMATATSRALADRTKILRSFAFVAASCITTLPSTSISSLSLGQARSIQQPIPIPIGNHKPSSHYYRQIGNYDSYWAKPG
jgi:hypothetical protein